MPRSFLTPAEQAMLDNARPSERVVVRDFFECLDARLVMEGGSAVLGGDASRSAPPSVTEPLFPTEEAT